MTVRAPEIWQQRIALRFFRERSATAQIVDPEPLRIRQERRPIPPRRNVIKERDQFFGRLMKLTTKAPRALVFA
jgi:hypothetical protein